ncbi:protease complex subunit PrcB family protein [Tissierella sp.]|uniref:protease complex subunit PrcB family protein n=1 Tax=Tissierella sp. TaxID=41274 RepID=UPI00285BB20C|nr:protease complex subunit PrcB family protein [Tissierella sp.]MDR7857000.1 protease complex subunit PrcB family protein [Tissierella sp.]
MKKIVLFLLVIFILSSSVVVFADMDTKLNNHWSKGMIEKEFLAYYFPYLAKDKFSKLDPKLDMLKQDFALSLSSLAKDYELDTTTQNIGINEALTRQEVVELIGRKLLAIDIKIDKNKELTFQDINTMDKESIELLRVLYNLEIIYGVSDTSFAPDKKLSQAEAIIILQRLKGVLDGMREISFNITGVVQGYNNQETVIVKELEDSVLVTLTKEFPTPGYSLGVDKILKEKDGYKIYLKITPPKEGMMQLQVLTYKTMTIEIDKTQLNQLPYVFLVDGIESNLF